MPKDKSILTAPGPGAHSIIGASGAERWMNCPGSVMLAKDMPNTSSPYALEGTNAHTLAEICLLHNISPAEAVSRVTFAVPQDMIDAVSVYVDYVKTLQSRLRSELKAKNGVDKPDAVKLLVETPIDLAWIHPGMFGTLDCALIAGNTLYTADYKHGVGKVVEVTDSPQLKYYALGMLRAPECKDIDKVKIVVVQPRAMHPGGPIRTWDISAADLMNWGKTVLRKAAKDALEPDAPLRPGAWCKFCRGIAVCPALVSDAMAVAKLDFAVIPKASEIVLPSPKDLTEEELARVIAMSDILALWAKEVSAYAFSLLESGKKIPGFKLVHKRSTRQWITEKKAEETLSILFGDDIYVKKLLTPPQAEKIFGKEIIASLSEKPKAGLTIALESDKRKAVEIAPHDPRADFEAIEDAPVNDIFS